MEDWSSIESRASMNLVFSRSIGSLLPLASDIYVHNAFRFGRTSPLFCLVLIPDSIDAFGG